MKHNYIFVFQISDQLRGTIIQLAAGDPSASPNVTANMVGIAYVNYSEIIGERWRCVGFEDCFGEVFARNVGKVAEGYVGHGEAG